MSTKPVLIIDGNPVADITEQAVEDKVEVVADGEKTWAQLLSALNLLVDWDKVSETSYITLSGMIHRYTSAKNFVALVYQSSSTKFFSEVLNLNGELMVCNFETNNSYVPYSSNVAGSGTKITLYYGSASIKADFETHANKCMMSDGTDVQSTIEKRDVVYYEHIASLSGTKTISNIPFKSGRSLYLVSWISDYPANDSGAWLIFRSPISGQTMASVLHQTNMTLSVSNTTITLNQTSGNADNGTLYVTILS